MKDFTIQLRVDFDDPEKYLLMKDAARQAAKHLVTTAMLISDKRKPQIAVQSDDYIDGMEEINLADDIPGDGYIQTEVT